MSAFDTNQYLTNMNVDNQRQYAILKLFVNSQNDDLKNKYAQHVNKHNNEVLTARFPNSGFDLFIPNNVYFDHDIESKFVDLDIYCEMLMRDNEPSGFFLFPRSSISKTPLMLANHTGIIDSGYRGKMIGAFRWLTGRNNEDSGYFVEAGTRLLQICHPSLCPILVVLVDNLNDLTTTERGEGGFGSTGR
jgi:dUTP pyrophosphatase